MNPFTKYINDHHFHLKNELNVIRDEYSPEDIFKFRAFRDQATDAYVKVFLSDDIIRYNFIDYTFHKINTDIQLNINDRLVKNGYAPLIGESIIFSFKGGNVMFEHALGTFADFEKFKKVELSSVGKYFDKKMPAYLGDDVAKDKIEDFIDSINSNIKISDVDYTIYILTSNYTRFYLIYKFVAEIIADSFEDICKLFDALYEHNIENIDWDDKYKETILPDKFVDWIYDLVVRWDAKEIVDANVVIDIISDYKKRTHIFTLLAYYRLAEMLKYKNKMDDKDVYLDEIRNRIIKVIKYKSDTIAMRNQYNANSFDRMKENIVKMMNTAIQKNKEYYDVFEDATTITKNVYYMKNDIVEADIDIEKRKNFILISNSSIFNKTRSVSVEPARYHYKTFNNIIKVIHKHNTIDFDLFRIKFNITLDNKIYKNNIITKTMIPSEFIDVSVPHYRSDSFKHTDISTYFDMVEFGNPIFDKSINIIAINKKEIINDLIYVLYDQNYVFPWLDKKYVKRIIRLIYFLYLHFEDDTHVFKTLIDFIYAIKNKDDLVINELAARIFIYDYHIVKAIIINNVRYDKDIGTTILVNDEYSIVGHIILNVLLCEYLFSQPDPTYLLLINQMRENYGFVAYTDGSINYKHNDKDQYDKLVDTYIFYGYTLLWLNINSKTQPNINSKTQPNINSKTQPNINSKTQPNIDSKTQPNIDSKPQPNIDSKPHMAHGGGDVAQSQQQIKNSDVYNVDLKDKNIHDIPKHTSDTKELPISPEIKKSNDDTSKEQPPINKNLYVKRSRLRFPYQKSSGVATNLSVDYQ